MSRLQVVAESVGSLLSVEIPFVLPAFQRSYVWTKEEVTRLLDDILVAMLRTTDPWHYLGTIILARDVPATATIIVDGQQRLTTFTILCAVLRDIETDPDMKQQLDDMIFITTAEGDRLPRLMPREVTAAFFGKYVQSPGTTALQPFETEAELSESQLNILHNRDYLRRRLRRFGDPRRRAMVSFIREGCELASHTVGSEVMARRIFINTQTTGLQPSINDILRADVIELIKDDEARDECGQIWDRGEAAHSPAGLRILLRHLRDRRLGGYGNEDMLAEDIIGQLPTPSAAEAFVREELAAASAIFTAFDRHNLDVSGLAGPINRRLQYLSWLEMHQDWQPVALHWLLEPERSATDTLSFLVGLDRLVYAQALLSVDADVRRTRFIRIMGEIDAGSVLQAAGALQLEPQQIDRLRTSILQESFKNRRHTRSLLHRIDGAMVGDGAVTTYEKGTVEHILPRSTRSPNSPWRREFGNLSEQALGALKYRLANLSLLDAKGLKDPGNKGFDEKRLIYRNSAFAITQQVASEVEWSPAIIERRAASLVATLFASWQIGA